MNESSIMRQAEATDLFMRINQSRVDVDVS